MLDSIVIRSQVQAGASFFFIGQVPGLMNLPCLS